MGLTATGSGWIECACTSQSGVSSRDVVDKSGHWQLLTERTERGHRPPGANLAVANTAVADSRPERTADVLSGRQTGGVLSMFLGEVAKFIDRPGEISRRRVG